MQSVGRVPRANYYAIGQQVETADTQEVLLERNDQRRLGIVKVMVENNTGAEETVTLYDGSYDEDTETWDTTQIAELPVADGAVEDIISSEIGLTIEDNLVVEASSTDLIINAWAVLA